MPVPAPDSTLCVPDHLSTTQAGQQVLQVDPQQASPHDCPRPQHLSLCGPPAPLEAQMAGPCGDAGDSSTATQVGGHQATSWGSGLLTRMQ